MPHAAGLCCSGGCCSAAVLRDGRRCSKPVLSLHAGILAGRMSIRYTHNSFCRHHLRECWAQRPEERPSFDEVVGRLRQLLDAAPPSPA